MWMTLTGDSSHAESWWVAHLTWVQFDGLSPFMCIINLKELIFTAYGNDWRSVGVCEVVKITLMYVKCSQFNVKPKPEAAKTAFSLLCVNVCVYVCVFRVT